MVSPIAFPASISAQGQDCRARKVASLLEAIRIRTGTADGVTFTADGTATSGSLYLLGRGERSMWCVSTAKPAATASVLSGRRAMERRHEPRVREAAASAHQHVEDAPAVTGRIRPACPIHCVVDPSDGGGLVKPAPACNGARVELYLRSTTWRARIRARVIRCAVRPGTGPHRLRGALEFDTPLLRAERFIQRSESAVDAGCAETRGLTAPERRTAARGEMTADSDHIRECRSGEHPAREL